MGVEVKKQELKEKERNAEELKKQGKAESKVALQNLNAEVKKTEKIAKKSADIEAEEQQASQQANAKQVAVREDTKSAVQEAKDGDVTSREEEQREKMEDAITKAEKFQASLPQLEQESSEHARLREEMDTKMKKIIARLHEELNRAKSSPATVNELTEEVDQIQA